MAKETFCVVFTKPIEQKEEFTRRTTPYASLSGLIAKYGEQPSEALNII
jgi:hypothetical protein